MTPVAQRDTSCIQLKKNHLGGQEISGWVANVTKESIYTTNVLINLPNEDGGKLLTQVTGSMWTL